MRTAQAIGFALAVLPIMLTPGVSVALVTERVLRDGRGAGMRVAAGTATGLAFHALAATLGLAALVAESAAAFTVVKLVGAAYLVLLGARLLVARARERPGARRLPWQGHGPYVQALLGNVLNPRAASIYLTLLPQFLAPGDDVVAVTLTLVVVHIAMQTVWLTAWTLLISGAREALTKEAIRRSIDRVAGGVLVGLGLRTALASRR